MGFITSFVPRYVHAFFEDKFLCRGGREQRVVSGRAGESGGAGIEIEGGLGSGVDVQFPWVSLGLSLCARPNVCDWSD